MRFDFLPEGTRSFGHAWTEVRAICWEPVVRCGRVGASGSRFPCNWLWGRGRQLIRRAVFVWRTVLRAVAGCFFLASQPGRSATFEWWRDSGEA